MSFLFAAFLLNVFPSTQATKKDQEEKKPAPSSLVCSACEGNGKPSFVYTRRYPTHNYDIKQSETTNIYDTARNIWHDVASEIRLGAVNY
jgi:hypothetical protein